MIHSSRKKEEEEEKKKTKRLMALLLGISLLLFVPGYGGESTTRLVQQVLETAPAAMVPINTGVSLAQLLPQTYNKIMLPQAKPTNVIHNTFQTHAQGRMMGEYQDDLDKSS